MNKNDDGGVVYIDGNTHRLLKDFCSSRGLKMQHVVGDAVSEKVERLIEKEKLVETLLKEHGENDD